MVVGGGTRANGFFTSLTSTNAPSVDSDRRFKRNITEIQSALDIVEHLTGVQYLMRTEDFPERNFSGGTQLGFIAQDVEEILPAVVTTMDDGFKAIQYGALTPVLINAIKELVQQRDEDREHIRTLFQQRKEDRALLAALTDQIHSLPQAP